MSSLVSLCLIGLMPMSDAPAPLPEGPAVVLIEQLSSDVWRERRTAERELVALGPAAVPALRATLQNNPDAETAACIESALARIAEESAVGPTRVTLRFDDADLDTVLAAISEQTGTTLGTHPPDLAQKINLPRINADYVGVPLWEVMCDLRRQTQLYLRGGQREMLLCNRAWQAVSSGPTQVKGPFLVEVREIRRERSVKFDAVRIADHAANDVAGTFGIEFALHPEPKVTLAENGVAVTIDQAADDRGNDLRTTLRPMCSALTTGGVGVKVPLDHPEVRRLGEHIEQLRGTVVATTLDGWYTLDANLADTTDQTPLAEWSARVQPVRLLGGRRYGLTVSISLPIEAEMSPADLFGRLEVFDSEDRPIRLRDVMHESTTESGQLRRYTLSAVAETSINPRGAELITPARLEWEIPTQRNEIETAFEFEGLPIP